MGKPKEYYIQAKNIYTTEQAVTAWGKIIQKASSANGIFAIKVMQQQWPVAERLHTYLIKPDSFIETKLKILKTALFAKKQPLAVDSFQ